MKTMLFAFVTLLAILLIYRANKKLPIDVTSTHTKLFAIVYKKHMNHRKIVITLDDIEIRNIVIQIAGGENNEKQIKTN